VKVSKVSILPLLGATPEAGWQRGTDPSENHYTLVLVDTDEGITGVGSCYTTSALARASLDLIEPLLIGENPLEPDRVSERLHQTTFFFGRGPVTSTIGAVDIALWDITGKALGQPVARLLGGFYRDRVQPYASILFADPPVLRERLLDLTERGYRAIKMGWVGFGRKTRDHDELLVRTAREAVGPDVDLLVDAGGSEEWWPHGYKWALERSHMLAEYNIGWFEEPFAVDDVDAFALLRSQSRVPIATGESLTRRQSFLPFLERRAVDIIQPDATKVGGISEMRKLGWMAHDFGIELVAHGWNTAIGVAADLHLAAARPIARYVEYQTDSPYIDGIAATPFLIDDDGFLVIPTEPGLGIELDWDRVQELTTGG
jgi:D-galactarolactone cycloisomerase